MENIGVINDNMKVSCFVREVCECGAGGDDTGAFECWEMQNAKLYQLLGRKILTVRFVSRGISY